MGLTADWWTAIGTMIIAVGAVGTLLVAVLAARYAKGQLDSARQQLDVMQRTREDETRPFVVVSLEPGRASRQFTNLVVENIGRTVAQDVRFTFDPPIRTTMDDQYALRESPLIRDGIQTMPPGQRITALFEFGPDYAKAKANLPSRYEVTVALRNSRGRQQEPANYVLDLEQFMSLQYIDEKGVHHVAKRLEEIKEILGASLGRREGLQVRIRDEDRRDQAEADRLTYGGRNPYLGLIVELVSGLPARISRRITLLRPGEWVSPAEAHRRLKIPTGELRRRMAQGEFITRDVGSGGRSKLEVWLPTRATDDQ